jgi:hypothetical protein
MKLVHLLIIFPFFIFSAFSQTTIILQPDAIRGKDAEIYNCVPCGYFSTNFGTNSEFSAIAWTNNGAVSNGRGLLEFDLSGIHSSQNLLSAKLSLYHNPSGSNGLHSSLSNSNRSILQRISQAWDESTVTWENQPTTSDLGQVFLEQSTSPYQNYLDIDVLSMVADMIDNPDQNFGFMIRLETEVQFSRMIFSSSDHVDPMLRPKLELIFDSESTIVENTNVSKLTVFPNPSTGVFTLLSGESIESIEVLNCMGEPQLVARKTLNEIDLGDLPKGIYFLKMRVGSKCQIEKVVTW